MALVECVPNFSEGRRKEVIDAIVGAVRQKNVRILDLESDPDHNRSVLTFAGEPGDVKEAALAVSAKAIELIDLNIHRGEHPRMGAVDVVPFVPISGVTMEDCVRLANEFAQEFAKRFEVPVFLYEEAATRPDRRNLADIRKGEFEGLRDMIGRDPDRTPDYGPNRIHPTAGATAVGARQILIAYNINLGTRELNIAKRIAHEVRGRDGGLAYVKALGFELKERGIVQVSMNMVNYKGTQLFKAFELVSALAKRYGVSVVGSEIVGLVPMDALVDCAEFYLKLENFDRNNILERKIYEKAQEGRLIDTSLSNFAEEVASEKPTPGGGSASAYSGALGAALASMVSRLTLKRKDYEKAYAEAQRILARAEILSRALLAFVDEDAEAYRLVEDAHKLATRTDEERKLRGEAVQEALKKATDVPLRTAEASSEVLALVRTLAEIGNVSALSEVETAVYLSYASIQGAASNVRINLKSVKDHEFALGVGRRLEAVLREAERHLGEAKMALASRRTH